LFSFGKNLIKRLDQMHMKAAQGIFGTSAFKRPGSQPLPFMNHARNFFEPRLVIEPGPRQKYAFSSLQRAYADRFHEGRDDSILTAGFSFAGAAFLLWKMDTLNKEISKLQQLALIQQSEIRSMKAMDADHQAEMGKMHDKLERLENELEITTRTLSHLDEQRPCRPSLPPVKAATKRDRVVDV
jgi:hypothetical protein